MSASKDVVELLNALGRVFRDCNNLHHERNEYHEWSEPCPVVAMIQELLDRVRD